jgi:hypothetical protein
MLRNYHREQPFDLSSRSTSASVEIPKCARISDLTSARWAEIRGWMLLVGAALCIALVAMLSRSAHASVALEERKLPISFILVPVDARLDPER